MNQHHYNGKKVYMGIDVHKKTYVCASICSGEVIKKDSMPAKVECLISYIHNNYQGAKLKTAYEAGFSGYHLHRMLIEAGISNEVIHAGSLEISSRNRVKTDKRDAVKIAEHLENKKIKGNHIPSESFEAERCVTRLRRNLVKLKTQTGNMLKSLLFTQGLIPTDDDTVIGKHWLENKLREINEKNYPDSFQYAVLHYAQNWFDFSKRIKEIEKQIAYQCKRHPEISIYRSVPGIGAIHSAELYYELDNMQHFSNEKKLFSYTGLTPSEYSSGEHIRHGHISRQGRPAIRKILVEAAWIAINHDASLQEVFARLSKHRGKKRAIVGVARRLVGRLRCCLKHGVLYESQSVASCE